MLKQTRVLLVTLFAGSTLIVPRAAGAPLDLTFVATPPILSGFPGSTLSYFARLNNTSGAPITLQGFNPGLTAPGLTVSDLFFTNVPDPLPAGPGPVGGYNIFNVRISPSAVLGTYTGTAVIDYDTRTAANLRVSQNYSVQVVSAVPEPGTWYLLAPGILLLAGALQGSKTRKKLANVCYPAISMMR